MNNKKQLMFEISVQEVKQELHFLLQWTKPENMNV